MKVQLAVLALASALSGCAGGGFRYEPSAPDKDAPRLKLSAAVLEFEDRTEDFVERGGSVGTVNAARSGLAGRGLPHLPGSAWAAYFAEELDHSGSLADARYADSPEKSRDADVVIGGRIVRTYYELRAGTFCDWVVEFSAARKGAVDPSWRRVYTVRGDPWSRKDVIAMMRDLFAQARRDLIRHLNKAP